MANTSSGLEYEAIGVEARGGLAPKYHGNEDSHFIELTKVEGEVMELQSSVGRLARSVVRADMTILEGLSALNQNSLGVLLIADSEYNLLGVVTDGDIRRGILARRSLEEPIEMVMNREPVIGLKNERAGRLRRRMWRNNLRHLPILDETGKLVGLEIAAEFRQTSEQPVAVIMAGGAGTRLRPLTDNCPKPLLEVDGKPILEHIIDELASQGFERVIISVNYKSSMIESYFGNGESFGVAIEYIKETKELGTAGALSLIEELPDSPVLVMNGDLLTKANLQALTRFHNNHGAEVTIAVTQMKYEVPYGVENINEIELISFEEKPEQTFFINAGIYVLEPKVISEMPKNVNFDMPDLVNLINEREQVAVFPLHEYWLDVGHMSSYEKAQSEVVALRKKSAAG